MTRNVLLSIGLGLFLIAIAFLIMLLNERRQQQARLQEERRRALSLPPGRLVYEDADGEGEPLSSDSYPLIGKPDYVVELTDGHLVPIELKLGTQNVTTPYKNHIMQLAAYCLILEDYSDEPPDYGILRYADCEFTIDYTPALRKKLLHQLDAMSQCSEHEPPALTKQSAPKCRACTFKPICPVGQKK